VGGKKEEPGGLNGKDKQLWGLVTLAGLALLVIILLSVPVDLVVKVATPEKTKVKLGLRWLFGLVNWEIKPKKKRARKAEISGTKPRKKGGQGRTFLTLLGTRGLARQFLKLLQTILHHLDIRGFKVDLHLGLGDPASTGMLFAIIGPPLTHLAPSSVKLTPSFEEAVFRGEMSGHLRLIPGHLVIDVLGFVFSRPTFRGIKKLIKNKWKRK